jgi:zinc transport system permease protein
MALGLIWKQLFAATVNHEIAVAENQKPDRANFFFMILMAAVIAVSMKIVGALLITALLIIPAATSRRFASTPEMMAVIASIVGALCVWLGLEGSLHWDTPAGPSIVVATLIGFIISLLPFERLLKVAIIKKAR